jgi:hypothetical protein
MRPSRFEQDARSAGRLPPFALRGRPFPRGRRVARHRRAPKAKRAAGRSARHLDARRARQALAPDLQMAAGTGIAQPSRTAEVELTRLGHRQAAHAEALATLVEITQDKAAPAAARVSAPTTGGGERGREGPRVNPAEN